MRWTFRRDGERSSSRPTRPARRSPTRSRSCSAWSRCSSTWSRSTAGACRLCPRPGTAVRRRRAASAGTTSTRTSTSWSGTSCTGTASTRPEPTCAECHSTDLVRGWDPTTRAFTTTHEDADVGCEACHGPGSAHVEWAEALASGDERPAPPARFLVEGLKDRDGGKWVTNGETGLPIRIPARDNAPEVETCAKCHSRRRPLTDGTSAGEPFLDGYEPSLLREGLYHADGQILDEVYVWGSFAQSRMHAAGVSCRDCHDHLDGSEGGETRSAPSATTRAGSTWSPRHHPAGRGARCVDCHMAERTTWSWTAMITPSACRAPTWRRSPALRTHARARGGSTWRPSRWRSGSGP